MKPLRHLARWTPLKTLVAAMDIRGKRGEVKLLIGFGSYGLCLMREVPKYDV